MKGIHVNPKGKLSTYLGILALVTLITFPAYADPVVKTTNGGTINVSFEPDPASPNPGDQTMLKISFINKHTNSVQMHIDYRVFVKEGDNQIFGIPITHTAEGSVSIPVQFPDAAIYQITVEVDGILFQPIPPETATFTLNVGNVSTPQGTGQTNSTGGGTQTSGGTQTTQIVIPSWIKNNAKWWHEGSIGDPDFVKGLQYMIQNGIVVVPPSQGTSSGSQVIPAWIKNDAGWWADGTIDDQTFVQAIQYLITNGIVVV
jgi:hypothetical protein